MPQIKETQQQTSQTIFNKSVRSVGPAQNRPDIIEVTITQIDVESGEDGDSVVLSGTDLPHQPFDSPVGSDVRKEYYPGGQGRRIPTMQVLGSYDENIIINGRLKATKIGDPNKRTEPGQTANILRRFAYDGHPVRMEIGEWIKYCLIVNFRPQYRTDSDISYSMEISVYGDENPIREVSRENQAKVFEDVDDSSLQASLSEMETEMEEVEDELDLDPADTELKQNGKRWLQNFNETLRGYADSIESFQAQVRSDVNRFYENSVLQDIVNARRNISRIRRSVYNSFRLTTYIDPLKLMEANIIINGIGNLASFIDRTLKRVEDRFRTEQIGRIKRVHIVKSHDTLQSIAVRYYGSYNNWEEIKNANGLQSNTIIPGQELIIPS